MPTLIDIGEEAMCLGIETAEEQRNRIATDILTCPKCDSENIELLGSTYDEDDVESAEFQCNECKHVFSDC